MRVHARYETKFCLQEKLRFRKRVRVHVRVRVRKLGVFEVTTKRLATRLGAFS